MITIFSSIDQQTLVTFHGQVLNSLYFRDFPQVIHNPLMANHYKKYAIDDDFYGILFDSMQRICENDPNSIEICSSDDIEDPAITGDYIYWAEIISDKLSFIFMEATHPWHYPHRAIFYDPKYKVHISGATAKIMITEGNQEEFSKFFIEDRESRRLSIKSILQKFDRPKLIDVYEKGDNW